jgi:hypothetical protein
MSRFIDDAARITASPGSRRKMICLVGGSLLGAILSTLTGCGGSSPFASR